MAVILKKYDVRLVQEHSGLYDLEKRITSSKQASEMCRELYDLEHLPYEKLVMFTLDNRHNVVGCFEVSRGTIDEASVYPREIVTRALLTNAKAVILCHNHPGGHTQPSSQDISITRRIQEVLGMLDIRLLDHVIVAHDKTYSMADDGLL